MCVSEIWIIPVDLFIFSQLSHLMFESLSNYRRWNCIYFDIGLLIVTTSIWTFNHITIFLEEDSIFPLLLSLWCNVGSYYLTVSNLKRDWFLVILVFLIFRKTTTIKEIIENIWNSWDIKIPHVIIINFEILWCWMQKSLLCSVWITSV